MTLIKCVLLLVATVPDIYYLIALYSSWRFFRTARRTRPLASFTPPISNLQPIRGLDHEAYENFASLCRQDYPDYELLFCVGSSDDPAVPVIEQLMRDFPQRRIRLLTGARPSGVNDKVTKLVRLVSEARNEVLVINDSDVRVGPDYLRTVVAPLQDPQIGAVTCFYASTEDKTFAENLQSVGMMSDFFAGLMVSQQLEGVRFALGTTIATTRARLAEFGGYESLVNRPGDDYLVGLLISGLGHPVKLLPYCVLAVPDYGSFGQLLHKRLRWMVVMRHMQPWGHWGLLFTHGLPWCLAGIALYPTPLAVCAWLGGYLGLRMAMLWTIGVHGLRQPGQWKRMPLIPLWDALAFLIWLASFTRSRLRWRDRLYRIRDGQLVPVVSPSADRAPGGAGQ
ncbi:MAG: glycosyltransferase [Bryobacteraceae bacterium]